MMLSKDVFAIDELTSWGPVLATFEIDDTDKLVCLLFIHCVVYWPPASIFDSIQEFKPSRVALFNSYFGFNCKSSIYIFWVIIPSLTIWSKRVHWRETGASNQKQGFIEWI